MHLITLTETRSCGASDDLNGRCKAPNRAESCSISSGGQHDRLTRRDHRSRRDRHRRRIIRIRAVIIPLPVTDVLRRHTDIRQLPEVTARGIRIDLRHDKLRNFHRSESHTAKGGVRSSRRQQRRGGRDRGIVAGGIDEVHQLTTTCGSRAAFPSRIQRHRACVHHTHEAAIRVAVRACDAIRHPSAAHERKFANAARARRVRVIGDVNRVHPRDTRIEVREEIRIRRARCRNARQIRDRLAGRLRQSRTNRAETHRRTARCGDKKLSTGNAELAQIRNRCAHIGGSRRTQRGKAHTTCATCHPELRAIGRNRAARIVAARVIRQRRARVHRASCVHATDHTIHRGTRRARK